MKINSIAIGNEIEAFIEDRFTKSVNVIFSYDNNKGKTIIVQGLMYALGNNPIFPSGFIPSDYYFIVDFQNENGQFNICRKKNSFVVKHNDNISIFETVAEFKYFYNENIYKLPQILKDGKMHLVGMELFYQLFFVGQDSRDTSKIFNQGLYNKEDFMEMIYSIGGCYKFESSLGADELNEKIQLLKSEKALLLKKNKILNSKEKSVQLSTYHADKVNIDHKIVLLNKAKNELAELKNQRNRSFNKKIKNELLIKELNSLNRALSEGNLKCLDCNSKHIGYESANEELLFDVADIEIRNQIMQVINNRIASSEDEIAELDVIIIQKQSELNSIMSDEDISMENLLFFKSQIIEVFDADKQIQAIDNDISKYMALLHEVSIKQTGAKNSREQLLKNIINDMQYFYNKIDPDGTLIFNELFTKKGITYSGCEGSEYYLSKLYSFKKNFDLNFPIIVDSFREGELSTAKEAIILDEFNKFSNQVIFTATLKEQEKNKYDTFEYVTKINYESYQTSRILQNKYVSDFKVLLNKFYLKC